jgi:MoaA/NifB/PqqE/SkfB family radical SAM enzyme
MNQERILRKQQLSNPFEDKSEDLTNFQIIQSSKLRGPLQVAFDITYRCNFRCLHCFNNSGTNLPGKDELKDDIILKIIRELADLEILNLCWCGGEPLLRENLIYKASEILARQNISVSMVTNGSLITADKVRNLKDSGLRRAQVSLDGATRESHERLRPYKDAFAKALKAISFFSEAGFDEVMVSFSPTSFNYFEIEDVANICSLAGVSTLRVQPLMFLGRAQLHLRELLPSAQQYRKMVLKIRQFNYKYGSEYIQWGDPIDHIIRFRSQMESCCPFVNIRANGDIVPSPYLPLVIGNLRKHSFKKYWKKGFIRIWELEVVKKMADMVHSESQLGRSRVGIPNVWFDKDVVLDFIDDQLYKSLKNVS